MPNKSVRIADITDGTTNTIMIGEQSDWGRDANGEPQEMRASAPFSLTTGCSAQGVPADGTTWSGDRHTYHLTTVRYRLNDKTYDSTRANGKGNSNPDGLGGETNKPIQSIHTGGVMVLLADGSSRFMSENIDHDTFLLLCRRADGQVIGEW